MKIFSTCISTPRVLGRKLSQAILCNSHRSCKMIVFKSCQVMVYEMLFSNLPAKATVLAQAEKALDLKKIVTVVNAFFEDKRKNKRKKRKNIIATSCKLWPSSPPATTETQSKLQTHNKSRVETPIPESLLRQSVPIKMWVAAEKLKEKNFREEQMGRHQIRMKDVQTSASPFQRKRCWGLPTETCKNLLGQVWICTNMHLVPCQWISSVQQHDFTISPTHNKQKWLFKRQA